MTGRRHSFLHRPHRHAALSAAAAAVCVALTAGCGVIPGTTGGSGDDPITVMTWAPENTKATNKPGVPAMAQAYARWVNAHGGIDGHELRVLTCNDHNDSAGAAKCARKAVDEEVVAVVGAYSQHARSFLAPLEVAGIPYIGGYGITDDEFSSPLSYPVNGGEPALLAGNGRQLADRCDRVSLVRPDTLAGDELPELLNAGLADGHHKPVADIRAPEDSTDLTPQAEQALRHAGIRDGCVTTALGARTDTFYDAFRRTRTDYPPVRISSVLGSVDQSLIDRTGGANGPYEGAYVTGWYPASGDPRWSQMRDVIREQAFGDNRVDPADAGVQTTWIAYTVLKQAVESLDGEVTARTVRRALDDGLRVRTGGLTPTLSWRFEDLIAASEFPRLINSGVTFQTVRDGRLVPARKGFVDVEKTLEQTA
ncbi:ABC transporter substrate-binding protein [Streptomyces sp. DSM 118878]